MLKTGIISFAALLMLGLFARVPAIAQPPDVFHQTTDTVTAFFRASEPITCSDGESSDLVTDVFLFVTIQKGQGPPGPPQQLNLIAIDQSDSCPGSQPFSG